MKKEGLDEAHEQQKPSADELKEELELGDVFMDATTTGIIKDNFPGRRFTFAEFLAAANKTWSDTHNNTWPSDPIEHQIIQSFMRLVDKNGGTELGTDGKSFFLKNSA